MAAKLAVQDESSQWAGLRQAIWWELLAVLAIFVVALALRVYRLHELPPGLFNDEAANGLDALAVLSGERPIFFPRNTGREPFFLYLQAGMMALVGPTPYSLRLTAAVVGALAVPAAYWMVRELFWGSPVGARRIALWSALFMAFGYWHISLSRIGFRANMLPLMAAIAFALFWRAWRTLLEGKRFPWLTSIFTGIALGATLYTYTASRFMPILLALTVLATILRPNLDRRL
jgi:4-amino-4-deoxy-L-arabinose transferase-like glycosyltransferase